MPQKDIFISYRREGGAETAKHLSDLLSRDGYRVAFDIDTLRSGLFDDSIYQIIDECTDFILILSDGCLKRCHNDNDWVRLEIAYAIKKGKNIIPIELAKFNRDIEFENLPSDIKSLGRYNAILKNDVYFDAFYGRLQKEYIKSRPVRTQPPPPPSSKPTSSLSSKFGCFVLVIVFVVGVVFLVRNQIQEDQQAEKERIEAENKEKEKQEIEAQQERQQYLDNISGGFILITDAYGRQGYVFVLTNLNSVYLSDVKLRIKDRNDKELFAFGSDIVYSSGGKWAVGFCQPDAWNWELGQKAEISLSSGIVKTWELE